MPGGVGGGESRGFPLSRLDENRMTNILLLIAYVAVVLLMLSVLVGYVFCNFLYGPWLLHRSGRRNLFASIINPVAGFTIERDLTELALHTGNVAAKNTVKLMTICKYSIIVNLLLFLGIFILIKFVI